MDDDQKKFILQLAFDTECFHCAFVDSCMMKNQAQSERCVPYCANYCMRWHKIFKGLSKDGGRADFSKKPPRLSLFNKSLWNEPNLGRTVPLNLCTILTGPVL
jgi:hypothetical protein